MSNLSIEEELWKFIRDPNTITMVETLGIEIKTLSKSEITATMPVDKRTVQYYGYLHGGASVALAETLASIAAILHVDTRTHKIVGLEINANHIRGVKAGNTVNAVGRPIHIGKKTQVWQIEIHNAEKKLVCSSRCTIAVVPLLEQ
ncbi:MAG: hotdog fold thioesterase [Oligoflexia bacterium]|nr:hotdog fold thioesterase [Oligoflexia bacterium]